MMGTGSFDFHLFPDDGLFAVEGQVWPVYPLLYNDCSSLSFKPYTLLLQWETGS